MNLTTIRRLMRDLGVRKLYAKRLAANDNSKNQVYLGLDFSVLNLLPLEPVQEDESNPQILKAKLPFRWVNDDGTVVAAPSAQVIFYPQYPEVRMSGFLLGSRGAPSELMRSRLPGRVLFLGVTVDQGVLGYVCHPDSQLAREFDALRDIVQIGVFSDVPLDRVDPRKRLVDALAGVVNEGWIESRRLDAAGQLMNCNAPNCGGYTLEAKLGVRPNGSSDPDFHGWELKAHSVPDLSRPHGSSAITLMTPEPTGGLYKTEGPARFTRRFGYVDPIRADRLNFSGRHFVGEASARSGLTMVLDGFDPVQGKITNTSGGIILTSASGQRAAVWNFSHLMTHWNKKHAFAAYVAAIHRLAPRNQYRYGRHVRLGEGTDFLLLLRAFSNKRVYYDPGIKVENASTSKPVVKRRSQFRIASSQIGEIYKSLSTVDVLA
jgi:hypothetical protein